MHNAVFKKVLHTLEEIKMGMKDYSHKYPHVRDSANLDIFMAPYFEAHVSALNELVLWGEVERTHHVLVEGMMKHFAITGEVRHLNYVPDLAPIYEAHKFALENFFTARSEDVHASLYYCGIKQLAAHGRRTDKHGNEILGVPVLPHAEKVCAPGHL